MGGAVGALAPPKAPRTWGGGRYAGSRWSSPKVLAATSHDLPFCEGKTGHLASLQAGGRLYVELSSAAKANRLVQSS